MSKQLLTVAFLGLVAGCMSPADKLQQAVEAYQAEAELLRSMEAEIESLQSKVRSREEIESREVLASNRRTQWKKVVAAKLRVDRLAEKMPAEVAGQ